MLTVGAKVCVGLVNTTHNVALWALPQLVMNAECACVGTQRMSIVSLPGTHAPHTCRATASNNPSIARYTVGPTRLSPTTHTYTSRCTYTFTQHYTQTPEPTCTRADGCRAQNVRRRRVHKSASATTDEQSGFSGSESTFQLHPPVTNRL